LSGAGTVTRETLRAFVEKTDELGGPSAPAALAYFADFTYRRSVVVDQTLDPRSPEYCGQQLSLYTELAGRDLDQKEHELTDFDFDRSVDAANPYGHRSTRFLAEHARSVCEAIALADLDDSPNVLDMGSGWGLSSELLAFTGCSVTAVDINHKFVELVRRRSERRGLQIEVVQSSFDEFKTDGMFDAVFFYECLHHAVRPWELLRKCGLWLRDGGKLIISGEPINEYWWKHWGLRLDALSVYCIHKFGWFESGWSMSFLKEMILDAGFIPTVYEGRGLGGAGVIIGRKLAPNEAFDRIQSLIAERNEAFDRIQSLIAERDEITCERDTLEKERDLILASNSWRAASPLRWLSGKLKRV